MEKQVMETLKKNILKRILYISLCFVFLPTLAALIATGCNDDKTPTGSLSLSLTDQPSDDGYKAVYITIDKIQIHKGNEGDDDQVAEEDWETIMDFGVDDGTYDLLSLVNCNAAQLGVVDGLAAGHYTQIRLILSNEALVGHPSPNYVVYEGTDEEVPLTVPSGYQTGIKLVKGFDIEEDGATELLLDFDVSESIHMANDSENLILQPTIKVLDLNNSAVVMGIIYREDGITPVEGALVQVYIGESEEPVFNTYSNELGEYCLTLDEGIYYIDASKDDMTGLLDGDPGTVDSVEPITVDNSTIYDLQNIIISTPPTPL